MTSSRPGPETSRLTIRAEGEDPRRKVRAGRQSGRPPVDPDAVVGGVAVERLLFESCLGEPALDLRGGDPARSRPESIRRNPPAPPWTEWRRRPCAPPRARCCRRSRRGEGRPPGACRQTSRPRPRRHSAPRPARGRRRDVSALARAEAEDLRRIPTGGLVEHAEHVREPALHHLEPLGELARRIVVRAVPGVPVGHPTVRSPLIRRAPSVSASGQRGPGARAARPQHEAGRGARRAGAAGVGAGARDRRARGASFPTTARAER